MYVIICAGPRYGSRDEIIGEWRTIMDKCGAFETLKWADVICSRCYPDEGGCGDDPYYYVADTSDPYLRPVKREVAPYRFDNWDEDIPF